MSLHKTYIGVRVLYHLTKCHINHFIFYITTHDLVDLHQFHNNYTLIYQFYNLLYSHKYYYKFISKNLL